MFQTICLILKKMQVLLKILTYEGQEIQVQISIVISSVLFIIHLPHSRKKCGKKFLKKYKKLFLFYFQSCKTIT